MENIPTGAETNETEKLYLYHMVPDDMRGNTLHPLNALKSEHPDLFIARAGKYKDRDQVMRQFIPTLEASWNDVLHFTAIHPAELKQSLIEAGMEPREMKFYQINPELLDPKRTTIYLYNDKTGKNEVAPEEFVAFDPKDLGKHSQLPQATKKHYRAMISKGEEPLLFIGVPHILHKGSLDISNLPVITV